MNKKLLVIAILMLLVIMSVFTVIAVAKTELARFEVINKTDEPVAISLTNENTFYYLTVAAGETKVFTVERLVYNHTIWSCGLSDSGSLDLETYMKLTFTQCNREAPNKGERGMEKVHIDDAPYGVNNRFEYEND
ncbi:MAG: hypothetical protein JSV42_06210 [Chloroflexota bacterium]|nr:MAG: hypothetical protein JSV42_06210 [Chloroflexota bacterium]